MLAPYPTMTRQLRVEAPSLGLRTAWPSDVLLHVAVVRTRGEGFDLAWVGGTAVSEVSWLSLGDLQRCQQASQVGPIRQELN